MATPQHYSEKDWLIHTHYGLGQIECIETKEVSGAKTSYFRIKTADSIFWIPVGQMESELIRPLCTPEEMQMVIAILERPPQEMSTDHKERKSRMRDVQRSNIPEDMARLIRDLQARQRDKGKYNLDENSTMRSLKQRLVAEWAMVMGVKPETIAARLEYLLNNYQPPAATQD